MAPSFIDNRCVNTRIDAMRREAPVNRDALVVGLDEDARRIDVDLPDGLLDL